MRRISLVLTIIGLTMLLVSFVPWPTPSGAVSSSPEVEVSRAHEPHLAPAAEQGKALFQAKGCVTCHKHDGIEAQTGQVAIGPNLSHYQPNPGFVRSWLEDPARIKPGTQMPNLQLSDEEITALIAFLDSNDPLAQDGPSHQKVLTEQVVTATPAPVKVLENAGLQVPDDCPVTRPPEQPFIPPKPLSAEAPYQWDFWYGTERLWTALPIAGGWDALPLNETGYTQKLFWWRAGYDHRQEPMPSLTVTGRRLDGDAPPLIADKATNGYHPKMESFMLTGVDFPVAGCWEVTGHYKGHELTFVVWVEAQ